MDAYFSFQWHITGHHNQCCRYCSIPEKNPAEMAYNDMETVFNNCLRMCEKLERIPRFYITGSNPILHRDFWKLLELLKSQKTKFGILGEPFHLTRDICDKLKYYGCENYQFSIDGLRAAHDKIHKSGSFDAIFEKIPLINNAGINSVIVTAVSDANIEEIPAIIDMAVQNKAHAFSFARHSPDRTEGRFRIAPCKYRDLFDRCWGKFTEYENKRTMFYLKDHLWMLFLYEKGLFAIPKNLSKGIIYENHNDGIGYITILPDGAVYACGMESRNGNALNTSLYDIFLNSMMDVYREYAFFGKCSNCELLRFCRGCSVISCGYAGNFHGSDPQCWKASTPEVKEYCYA
jgi:radical SAM/SPASM domain protein of ACGX system